MKKYIIPNTETMEVIYGKALCHSTDGSGQQNAPQNVGGTGSNAAPKRIVF